MAGTGEVGEGLGEGGKGGTRPLVYLALHLASSIDHLPPAVSRDGRSLHTLLNAASVLPAADKGKKGREGRTEEEGRRRKG